MSRQFIIGIVALASLTLCSVGFGQAASSAPQTRPAPQGPAAPQQEPSATQQLQRLQSQIDELQASQKELIEQLNALHATAVKEKATATAGAIEKLISQQRDSFQAKIRQLQRQQQPLRQQIRDQTGGADRASRQPRRAPEFQLKNVVDDKTVKLSDYRGKIVVLEWINLDCPFSMYHHKTQNTMVDLANKYRNKAVVWLAINSTSTTTPQANANFAKEQKLPYPLLDDRSGGVGRSYGVQKTPQMFIIDPRGLIVYDGAIDNAAMGEIGEGQRPVNYVDQALAALVNGQEVPTPMTIPYGSLVKYAAP